VIALLLPLSEEFPCLALHSPHFVQQLVTKLLKMNVLPFKLDSIRPRNPVSEAGGTLGGPFQRAYEAFPVHRL
jgi:hypothetical protein